MKRRENAGRCTSITAWFHIIPIYLFCSIAFAFIQSPLSAQTIRPIDRHIIYEGRVAVDAQSAQLMWPGTSVTIRFEGSGISATVREADTANYYNIIIDKDSIRTIHFDTVKRSYVLAEGLHYGRHSVQLFKRTEWDKGKTLFYGFDLMGKGRLLKPEALPKRRIEFYGNSISCGYAIEDKKGDSPFGFYEDNYDAYPAITARHFNAQYHCIAKSGIGIMISWFPLIMPEMYNRLDPTDSSSRWDFSRYTPDVVVINLFQNDSWLIKQPQHVQFKNRFGIQPPTEDSIISACKNFVQRIRKVYPKARIICMLGNMDITREGSPWPGYVRQAVAQLHNPKIFTLFVPYKQTPGHPKTAEQKALADALIRFIEQNLRW